MSSTQQLILGEGAGGGGYQIERSLRFNSADSAYLNRTPASAGNRKTWTWSGWVKRSVLGTTQDIFAAYQDADNQTLILFNSADKIIVYTIHGGGAFDYGFETTAVYRDVSAWYHIVAVFDSTNATAANRAIVYVNGVLQAGSMAYGDIPLNQDGIVNATQAHNIGRRGSAVNYFNGYLTEVNFIDGQALTPSSFGQSDPNTGVWSPIKYTGTYGTNGFYLNFSDNSNTTAGTLGKDSSGNGNNWTPNNFSVTAGAGNDSLVDTPTSYGTDTGVGGEVRGNYATLNPLYNSGGTRTFANGNLEVTGGAINNNSTELANWQLTTGKWYFEATVGAIGTASITAVGTNAILYQGNGSFFPSGSGASYTTNDVIGVAIDVDAGTVQFYKNGVSQGTVNGTAGAAATPAFALGGAATAPVWIANFGQRPFAYTAPSGFKALCTQNLPTPTIGATSTTQANKYFDASLYTGNGSTQSITNSGSMQPDFVWYKERSSTSGHLLFDAIRGVQNYLTTNATDAETTNSQTLTSFNSNGFSVGNNSASNENGVTYVGWQWNAGGSNATNTSGTITSTVRANTTAGFSIVTYTGTGANATVGHGLGVAPSMIIYKRRSASDSWIVYHASIGAANNLVLNSTAAQQANGNVYWNSTAPTSSVFGAGTDSAVNANASTYVAYCFAAVAGYSAFGSYTGNGSTNGPFIYTGFRPAYVLIKAATVAGYNWNIVDDVRSTYNESNILLSANTSNAEVTSGFVDILSNGFKVRTAGGYANDNAQTYIYAAFAEFPFKYTLAR